MNSWLGTGDLPQPWADWVRRRPPTSVLHLDSAAAGRGASATLQATAEHARREARDGAYVAEEQADPVLAAGHSALAELLGVPQDGLAFVGSATAALATLLRVWPLAHRARVGVLAAEWGPNLEAIADHGLVAVELASDGAGRVDLDALELCLRDDPPAVVHLTQVSSHRGLVQPVAAAGRLCRAAGVALWVDAAQALGHVDTATGADAVYATSRKWLTGPRGVGVLGIAETRWAQLRVRPSALSAPDLPTVRHLEPQEAHVAGRVGLCTAIAEFLDAGAGRVWERLDDVGRRTRAALADVAGWQVVGDGSPGGAITSIRPTDGQDVFVTRARLLAKHSILTTACGPARAPREMTAPLLRISPHVDCSEAALARLCAGLRGT